MSRFSRSSLTMVAATIASTVAQSVGTFPATPLASRHFAYPTGIPYQVDTENLVRGTQFGFNICNSTTQNQNSNCQTLLFNHIDDFCLWAPPEPDSTIGATEGEAVAWCTTPKFGTRLIPEGTLRDLQYIRTPDYIQIVGHIDQSKLNLQADDFGGELDPHGADLRGNPLGGLVYSNAFGGGGNDSFTQVIEWHSFIGGDFFCFKACDPAGANAADFCQHIYDRIGCAYNAPTNNPPDVFEACDGENQDFPGVYTQDGQVLTYTQPAESLGPITSIPYTARIPASSNCVTFQSAQLFSALPSVAGSSTSTATGTAGTSRATGSTSSRSGSGSAATQTASSARAGAVLAARRGQDNGGFAGAVIALSGALLTAMLLA